MDYWNLLKNEIELEMVLFLGNCQDKFSTLVRLTDHFDSPTMRFDNCLNIIKPKSKPLDIMDISRWDSKKTIEYSG